MLDLTIKTENGYERAVSLNISHPDEQWILVEFCLPMNGRKRQWVNVNRTKKAYFRNTLDFNASTVQKNSISVEFLKKHHYKIPVDTLIDNFGFCYLTDEQEKDFWTKFFNKGK